MESMGSFIRFPNIRKEPVELQTGLLGDVFRNITPTFLRNEEGDDFFDGCCPRITLQQRLFGWVVCLGFGLMLQAASFGAVTRALMGHPGRFAMLYTTGNVVAMVGTFFLAGPAKQMRRMSEHSRATTSVVFILAMVMTVVVAEAHFPGRALLVILLVVIQWCALVWYTLSYIPYGRKVAKKLLRKCTSWCCTF
ncbi:unnamed protein product [Polarella glacialis]|uniref:Vesicle transport protein n=1 Tax=Polarella glacialis TaxID=89957 RepID=A0A813H1U9_POLGL|nr:unnamed protein product [Polarella glacialis]|mmetsp:Transcript_40448/g.65380  ORF Transcript_40448/g.65380 Transcript_40448/m.65380 type:complete len:194 (+) Transcript_40448:128-709(+)